MAPKRIPVEDIITSVEAAIHPLQYEEAEHIRHRTRDILLRAKPPKPNISKGEREALYKLKQDRECVNLKAGKGNATVIVETEEYNRIALDTLNDKHYKELAKNPIKKMEHRVNSAIE